MGHPSSGQVLSGIDPLFPVEPFFPVEALLPVVAATAVVAGFAVVPWMVGRLTTTARPGPVLRSLLDANVGLPDPKRVRVISGARGRHIDAFAVGIVPDREYVYVTDALVESFDDDELAAVLAHEAGHVELNHLRKRCGVAALAGLGWGALAAVGVGPATASVGFGVTLFAGMLALGVRQEYDADRYAARRVGREETLRALERLKRTAPPSRVPAPLDRLSARAWLRARIGRLRTVE